MKVMISTFAIALVAASVLAQGPTVDWRKATTLPGVELEKLTPAQRKIALSVLRDYGCACGCSMQLAQCRVEDPDCSQSRTLTALVVEAAAAGQSAAQIRKTIDASPLVKSASLRDRLLLDPVEIPIANAPSTGPANAKITLVEFSDFQCPFCVRGVAHIKAVLKAFPSDVRLVYKQFPLDSHSQAALASRASLAAHAQGKFWPLHDRMYANSRAITRASIVTWANDLGLDMASFTAALDSPAVQKSVDRDIEDGERAGVSGTPTIFLNGKKYQGSLEPEVLLPVIAAELKNLIKEP